MNCMNFAPAWTSRKQREMRPRERRNESSSECCRPQSWEYAESQQPVPLRGATSARSDSNQCCCLQRLRARRPQYASFQMTWLLGNGGRFLQSIRLESGDSSYLKHEGMGTRVGRHGASTVRKGDHAMAQFRRGLQ